MSDIPDWMLAVSAAELAEARKRHIVEAAEEATDLRRSEVFQVKARRYGPAAQLKAERMIGDFLKLARHDDVIGSNRIYRNSAELVKGWSLTREFYLSETGYIYRFVDGGAELWSGRYGWDPGGDSTSVAPSWLEGQTVPHCGLCGPGNPRVGDNAFNRKDPHAMLLSRLLANYAIAHGWVS